MRKHKTEKEKEQRRNAYWCLRQITKINSENARIFRDWTDNKILMILKGEAKPIK